MTASKLLEVSDRKGLWNEAAIGDLSQRRGGKLVTWTKEIARAARQMTLGLTFHQIGILTVIYSSYYDAFFNVFFSLLVHFLGIRGWTKGKAAIGEVLPAPWKLRKLFVPLLPAAAAVHLDCIWLSAFFSCQEGRRNYIWKDQRRQVRLSISLHFVILWVCVCMCVYACLEHLKAPPFFYICTVKL